MASIKIEANVQPALTALSSVNTKIKELQEAASKVKIEIKADGIQKLDKETMNAVKSLAKYAEAQAKLTRAQTEAKKAENDLLIAQNKTKQAIENSSAAYNKYRESIEKTKQAQEKTAQAVEKTAQAQEKTTQVQTKAAAAFKDTGDAAEQAGKKTQGFISTFVKSAVIYQAIYAIRQAFMDALDTMKEVDSQLVTVRKVTQATDAEISQLRSKAYQTASKYGVGAGDYLESVAEFARAGYKGMSDSLAELSTKTQIVGDTTAEVANQFLLSMDAAYKYNGSVEKLTRVLDGANEIDNNYATSIQKIAEGLGLIAPIASQVHVSEQELTSAIGTITAVTQRSGSEAARALRALFLNIIGDTTTEIEDGVTATEESVTSLRTLLKDYAPDAVAAAEATGKIIDPMEAIGALSNAMKNGLLTEQELMEKLSSLGGKLRTSQLVALVSNFDMYQQMMGTYADSIGSADKEVENALDSWERKTAILANTWTEFIQGSINTDFIKGFLDGLTQVIKLFGNLGNALMTVGGLFVALKLPSIVESFKELATKARDFGKELGSSSGGIQRMQLAIAGVTAAITVYNMAANAHKQALEDAANAANEEAEAAKTEADSVYEAYAAYNTANEAVQNNTGTKEQLQAATDNLISALGLEKGAIDETTAALQSNSIEVLENAKAKVQAAKNAAEYQFMDSLKLGANTGVGWIDQLITGFSGTSGLNAINKDSQKNSEKTSEAFKRIYKEQKKVIDEYTIATKNNGKATAELEERYRSAQQFIGQFGETIEQLISYDDQLADLDDKILNLPDALSETEDALSGIADDAGEAAKQYGSLSDAVAEAETAITKFNEATKTEKDDPFKSYAGIYESFLTDWEAGLKGSNKVREAIKALLPEDALQDLWAQGRDAGELLASDFYQSIFTYIDENGARQFTKGEDRGSLLAYALWDNDQLTQLQEDGSKVIKLGDEVVASLRQDGEELSVSVDDFDKLAQALYEVSGVPLSGEFLASWMQALGMYSPELQITTDELKDLAEAANALNGNTINLQDFVQGQLDLGTAPEDIRQMVDKLIELQGQGEVDLNIQADSIEDAKAKVNELIEKAQEKTTVEVDGTVAEQTLSGVGKLAEETAKKDVKIEMSSIGYQNLINQLSGIKTATDQIPRTVSINFIQSGSISMPKFASGTTSAPGGITLVNEQGPEIIQDGAYARIAGGGMPTITWVDPGSTIYTAGQTKSILGNADPSLLFGGIGAFAGGTASGITRWRSTKSTAAASAAGTAVGASAARGTSTSRINTSALKTTATAATNDNDRLKQLKDIVSLRESELSLLQAQEAPVKDQINKNKQIQQALMDQINYMKSIGGSQEEINQLYTKWYKIQKDIADLQDNMYKELQNAVKGQIDKLNKAREEEKKALQDQIDAMKEARDTRDEQLELEEKILAVQKAEQALQNAMTERTVRFYNASTGQWEWAANASNVKSAAEQLESAQQALMDYQDNAAYNAAIAELEAQQDAIDAKYDDLETRWNEVIDSFEAPVKSIDEALNVIAKNYVPSMEKEIINLNSMIESFGYHVHRSNGTVSHGAGLPVYDNGGILSGVGGIKATGLNEMILPPDITQRMLSVTGGSLIGERLNELRYLYGVSGSLRGSGNTSIGSQHNGDVYRFGNISLSAAQAESMTVAELARASRNLRLYSANM